MTKIVQRHDTAANWTSVNPVLAAGEMGVETDTNKFKFGDGVTAWSGLPYASGEGGSGSGTTLTSTDGTTTYSKLALGNNLVVDTEDIAWTNPQMSSNSQDGYVASASVSASTSNGPYRAFDKDTTGQDLCWYTGSVSMPQWIMLECQEPVRLTSCMIMNEVKTPESFKSGYIQGSNDGSTFDNLYTITDRASTASLKTTYQIDTDKYYKYLRVYCTANSGSGLSVQEIEFKGFIKDASAVPSLNVNLDTKQDKLTAKAPLKIAEEGVKELSGIKEYQTGGTLTEDCVYSLNPNMASVPGLISVESVPFSTASNWEIVIKTEIPTFANALCKSNVQPYGFEFGKKYITLSTTGKIWDYVQDVESTTNSLVGQTLFMRYQFTGAKYTVGYSSDDITYTALATFNTSRKIKDQKIALCDFYSSTSYYNGKVYLADSYYKIDGVKYPFVVEHGKLTVSSNVATTSSTGVVQPDGTTITVNDAGIISGQDVRTFTGYSDTGTLVLKSINGVLQWVTEG